MKAGYNVQIFKHFFVTMHFVNFQSAQCHGVTSANPHSQVHTFYKTWAETYEDDMNKLNFTSENSQFDFVAFRRI